MTAGQQGVITVESGKFDHGSAQIVKLDSTEIIVSNQQYFHPGTFIAIDDPQYRLHLTVSQPTVLNFQLLQSPTQSRWPPSLWVDGTGPFSGFRLGVLLAVVVVAVAHGFQSCRRWQLKPVLVL